MVRIAAIASAIFMSVASVSANAATISFTLGIGGDSSNVPTFTLQNTSTVDAVLRNIRFTIGDTTRHFDFSEIISNGTSANAALFEPDTVNGGLRSDTIFYGFSGGLTGGAFFAGEQFVFNGDVDLDPDINSVQNFDTVFGNNGDAPNSVATVEFLFDGQLITLSDVYADNTGAQTLSGSLNVGVVPVPAALPLLVTALAALGFLSRRKKQVSPG